MEDFLKTYGTLIGATVVVSVALCGWLYSLYRGLRKKDDELKDLNHGVEKKFERLDEKFIGLEKRVEQVFAEIGGLHPVIRNVIEQDAKGKKK
jgi:hypothetical protein